MNHGFRLTNTIEVPEQSGIMHEYVHEATGARLLHMETADQNKLFSVAFRTTPTDDTGVFHILEHSVLCGSDKYPVKEPFVELLKSSMNTFLNALTFQDKTMYPVSSRNEKDFFNLMSVYLDAVFHPSIYSNPNIFYQEGWHYDYQEKGGDISYKGVVLNEMKGSVSSIDTQIHNKLMRLMFPDTCYGFVSGGAPEAIPTLSYEQFLEAHREYYSAANAIFYLEGAVDLDKSLAMIEEALADADVTRTAAQFVMQGETAPAEISSEYAVTPGETTEKRTKLAGGKIFCDYTMKERIYSTMMLCAYLTDSNEAPLVRAILEKDLAEDVRINLNDGILQPYLQLSIENTEPECIDEIKAIIRELRAYFEENGVSAEELEPTLNNVEFAFRDVYEPKGLIHNMMALNSYMYGGDPTEFLRYNDTFAFMREQLGTDYYKELILEMLDIDSYSIVTMIPSETAGAISEEEEIERAIAARDSWSEEEEDEVLALNAELLKWQETSDTEEQLATIPKLSLADIDEFPTKRITVENHMGGTTILEHPTDIDGLSYINLYFGVPKEYMDMIPVMSVTSLMLGKVPTKKHNLFELTQQMKSIFGSIEFGMEDYAELANTESTKVYLVASFSCLTHKIEEAKALIKEILFESDFETPEFPLQVVRQDINDYRDEIITSGNRIAVRNISAGLTASCAAKEALDGMEFYDKMKEISADYDNGHAEIVKAAKVFRDSVLTREELVCSITIKEGGLDIMKDFVMMFPEGEAKDCNMEFPHTDAAKNLIKIPAAVSYAAAANNMKAVGASYHGAWRVLTKIVSLEYLWQEVRVKGGAYGCNMRVSGSGNIDFSSYRDPAGAKTYEVYAKTGDFIREFAPGKTYDSYIISTLADMEPLLTPKHEGTLSDHEYLIGVKYEMRCKRRLEMINTTEEQLLECADVLDKLWESERYCLVTSDPKEYEADLEIVI